MDTVKVGAMLQRKKGAASERLLRILADETASQQERVDAQYDLNQAKDAWKAFQEATEVEEAEKAPTKIHTLVPKELPAFQIKGGPTRDKSKKVHDSVRAFIGAFEVQLGAYNLVPIDDHWERLFLLTCDETQHQWFARTLTNRQLTWSQVCACLEKEFGNPFYLWSKKDEYHQLVQRPDESVRMYLERYQEAAYEAILKQDQELVYTFVCSLQPKTKKRAWSTLTNHYGLALTSDIHQAAQLIMASSVKTLLLRTFQAKACQLAAANADTFQKNTPAIKSRKTVFTVRAVALCTQKGRIPKRSTTSGGMPLLYPGLLSNSQIKLSYNRCINIYRDLYKRIDSSFK